MSCVGEPISWLRLEQAALGARDGATDAHLAACPACRACFDEIRADVVALPPLAIPARTARAPWWRWAMPAMGLAAAAAILVLVLRPRPTAERDTFAIKGVGDVTVSLVRDRASAIDEGATTFHAGDRWKVVVTCAPGAATWLDVAVLEQGVRKPDYPLAAAHLTCGNRVVLPGAFELTGSNPNRVCVYGSADDRPARGSVPDDAACVTVRPD